jgi:hypothetical protein
MEAPGHLDRQSELNRLMEIAMQRMQAVGLCRPGEARCAVTEPARKMRI